MAKLPDTDILVEMLYAKIKRVNAQFTIEHCENGWIVKVSGLSPEREFTSIKIVCHTDEEINILFEKFNRMAINGIEYDYWS